MADYVGTSGADIHDGTPDPEALSGLEGNDTLRGAGGDDTVHGGDDNDLLDGDSAAKMGPSFSFEHGDDTVFGDDGNDTVYGGEGNDQLDGGIGDDLLFGDRSFDLVSGPFGTLAASGTSGANGTLDTLNGGAGNDTLYSDYGPDTLDGGDDFDRVVIDRTDSIDAITVDFSGDSSVPIILPDGTSIVNFEELYLYSGQGSDSITGGAGNDDLRGNIVSDTTSFDFDTLNGGGGDDTLYGFVGDDSLSGGEDDDLLFGGSGADTLIGGTGNDYLNGDAGPDSISGGSGDDTVEANPGTIVAGDVFDGGDDTDELVLSGSADIDLTAAQLLSFERLAIPPIAGEPYRHTFSADQLGGGGLADDLSVRAAGSTNLVVAMNDPGTTDLSGWTFDVWDDGIDTITVNGSVGDDLIVGSSVADTLDGGGGNDTLRGGLGDDRYIVDSLTDQPTELPGGGTDTIVSAIDYGLGADFEALVLIGTAVRGYGNSLDNTIIGNDQANILRGFEGDDRLDGAGGDDTMFGGTGNDTYVVTQTGDFVSEAGGDGIDTVEAAIDHRLRLGVENLVLTGTAIAGYGNGLDNEITGDAAANFLKGFAGDDRLDGGAGADTMYGGTDNDTYVVDQVGDLVSEAGGDGVDTVEASIDYRLRDGVENLLLTGTAIEGYGNALDNGITGNGEANFLKGFAGNDRLDGAAGADTMYGGTGNDTYVVDQAGDVVSEAGGGGIDTVEAAIDYLLRTGFENLTLAGTAIRGFGNALDNEITGTDQNNVLKGFAGADQLTGHNGNDILEGGAGGDTLDGGIGLDTASYANAAAGVTADLLTPKNNTGEARNDAYVSIEWVTGSAFNDFLRGDNNANTLYGLAGVDQLLGRGHDDRLIGGDGNDRLDGGPGGDTLIGGAGNDTFEFHIGEASGDGIVDFDGQGAGPGDTIEFHGYGTEAQGASFTQVDAIRWVVHSNAFGGVNETITLAAGTTVDATDYIFI